MNIDVVGGSGFIGTRLVTRFRQGENADVKIIDKVASNSFPELSTVGDVRSLVDLQSALRPKAKIINLAAEHRDDVLPLSLYQDVNVGGATNICTAARDKGVETIVFTSTVAVYGFARVGTDENGQIAPFNEYGRTKYEAEQIYRRWQKEDPDRRTLVIIRPTVVFGEQNRGNVYNLLRQIASGRFIMVGPGRNQKSLAYVENVAAFIQHCLDCRPGVHVYNFVDKPDLSMNDLVRRVNRSLGRSEKIRVRLPYWFGYTAGLAFDIAARVSGKRFPISSIRVKKFCSDSVYDTAVTRTSFVPPVSLDAALDKTIRHEFLEARLSEPVFYSE